MASIFSRSSIMIRVEMLHVSVDRWYTVRCVVVEAKGDDKGDERLDPNGGRKMHVLHTY